MASAAARSRLAAAEELLAEAGVPTPRHDAELLLAAASDVTRSQVVSGLYEPSASQLSTFDSWVARRAERVPLQHIVERVGFRRVDLNTDWRALIPRPETELLVAVAKVGRPCAIIDVGTGSGAVAIALADELPDATVAAVDISEDALSLAKQNAAGCGFGERIEFGRSDLLESVEGTFDAVVANLPYIPSGEIPALEPEVSQFEPLIALDGGPDGLDLVRRLAGQAPAHLNPGGLLALEIGEGQAAATETILRGEGFVNTERHRDLAGIERVVAGFLPR